MRTRKQRDEFVANDVDDPQIGLTFTNGIKDMSTLFHNSNVSGDTSTWETSLVAKTGFTFLNADNFSQSIGNWNTSQVASMEYMFAGAGNFDQEISDRDTSQVPN